MAPSRIRLLWARAWMSRAGLGPLGRLAMRVAGLGAAPYKGRCWLAEFGPTGYISARAEINRGDLRVAPGVFVGDRCVIHQADAGATVDLRHGVHLYRDVIIEAGRGGGVFIDEKTHIQPGCRLWSYEAAIRIGKRVEIAAGCAFYPYDHGMEPGVPIRDQPLVSRGDIVIEDDAWLGYGVTVLDGVRIGEGAVVGAGAVVTRDVAANSVVAGVPAKVVGTREPRHA
ncbi:MAG: acyltransferase [bacterium]|nr:acyltransferase [bacterium]